MIDFSDYLDAEWVPALGCTEPASIALAAATASSQSSGEIKSVRISCDPRMYKNCYAVGIPFSQGKVGGHWAAALGSLAEDPSVGLEVFKENSPERIDSAASLLDGGAVIIDVDTDHQDLWVDCYVQREEGEGRAVIAGSHNSVVRIERDGKIVVDEMEELSGFRENSMQHRVADIGMKGLMDLARSIDEEERLRLEEGIELNMAIAKHGETLFPDRFSKCGSCDLLEKAPRLVCGGVYARMSGEDFSVMSLAGSGNKGITATVPLVLWAKHLGVSREHMQEALALACLMTSATTNYLGTLSAMCGCANAAGVGLAAGRIYLENGDEDTIAMAVNNMVGNLAGMICDGAKIGCGMKALTAVDAAYRSTELALAGVGIPVTDGIVGSSIHYSLTNLGKIAQEGMAVTDESILDIMKSKHLLDRS